MKYLKHIFFILFMGATLLTGSCENKPSEKEELELLMKEFDKGIINADEYKEKKAEIIARHKGGGDGPPKAKAESPESINVESFDAYDNNDIPKDLYEKTMGGGCSFNINNKAFNQAVIFHHGLMKINGKYTLLNRDEGDSDIDDNDYDDSEVFYWSNSEWTVELILTKQKYFEIHSEFAGKATIKSKKNSEIKTLEVTGVFEWAC